jgi:thiol:disulfide interchange protein DsbA
MNKIAQLFVILILNTLFFSVQANEQFFEEDKHYEVISQIASSEPNITEYFSFYCSSCFRYEVIVEGIKNNLPDDINFKRSHVDFLGGGPERQQNLSRAIIVAKKLKHEDEMVNKIFSEIHTIRRPINEVGDIRQLFVTSGFDDRQFDDAWRSFSVIAEANRMKKAQDDLSSRQVLTSVPMFVVNDKYKIISAELHSIEEYNALIEFLLSKD